MPTKLPADEEKILRFFIKEGAVEEKIPIVANRFRMKVGEVRRKLALKRVQEELRIRMEPVRLEQQRQQVLADSVAEATAKLVADKEKAEAELKAATQMPPEGMTVDLLERELMRIACLDPEKHGRIKLMAIQTGYVIKGVMEQGNTRRVAPTGPSPSDTPTVGVYTNIFDRLRQERAQQALPAETPTETILEGETEDDVFDLTPQLTVASQTKKTDAQIPLEGEEIEIIGAEISKHRDTASRVITVEIG